MVELDRALIAKFLGFKITGVAKCLACKMSVCQNVSICMQWHTVWVAQCLGGTMFGWKNVLLSKCLDVKKWGVKMSGCQNIRSRNNGESKIVGVPLYGIGP